jgi:hypothetical protein
MVRGTTHTRALLCKVMYVIHDDGSVVFQPAELRRREQENTHARTRTHTKQRGASSDLLLLILGLLLLLQQGGFLFFFVCWVFGTHHEVEEWVERSNRQCCSQTTQPEQHQSRPERETHTNRHAQTQRERERESRGCFTVADNEKGDDDELFDRDGCIWRSQMSADAARTIGVQAVLGQNLKKRLL